MSLGLTLVSWVKASPLIEEEHRFRLWQDQGRAGELKYMLKPAIDYLTPTALFPGAQTLITVALRYASGPAAPCPLGSGKVARYAWGRDYHKVLTSRLERLATELSKKVNGFQYRVGADALPLHERAFAERSGLGFIGKNTLLISPGVGSLFFLGELISNLTIEGESPHSSRGRCSGCTRCGTSCPTGALDDEYSVDARKCISYLTIEKRGMFSSYERGAIGNWLFGCDVCQEVCPFNHRAIKNGHQFEEEFAPCPPIVDGNIRLDTILTTTKDEEFSKRWAHSPLRRAKREGLTRNACCVAVNTKAYDCIELIRSRATEDTSPVIRAHALWAFCALDREDSMGGRRSRSDCLNRALSDESPIVVAEATQILEE